MSWARLDDTYCDHPKVLRAWSRNPGAVGLHVMSITYCARHRTDGHVPAEFIALKIPRQTERKKTLEVLIDAGLFDERAGEYYVHDFLNYNGSREDNEQRRAEISRARAEAGRRGAKKRWQTDSNADGKRDGKRSELANGPDSPRPDPTRPEGPPSPPRGNRTRDRQEWEDEAVAYAESVGVTGPRESVLRAVRGATSFAGLSTPEEFRGFARQHYPSLRVVADLPDSRSAA